MSANTVLFLLDKILVLRGGRLVQSKRLCDITVLGGDKTLCAVFHRYHIEDEGDLDNLWCGRHNVCTFALDYHTFPTHALDHLHKRSPAKWGNQFSHSADDHSAGLENNTVLDALRCPVHSAEVLVSDRSVVSICSVGNSGRDIYNSLFPHKIRADSEVYLFWDMIDLHSDSDDNFFRNSDMQTAALSDHSCMWACARQGNPAAHIPCDSKFAQNVRTAGSLALYQTCSSEVFLVDTDLGRDLRLYLHLMLD
jgi:hypothetical protein